MGRELISQLNRYEHLCNAYAIDAILDMFTDDGTIVVAGISYGGKAGGKATLRNAHEFDRGNRSHVRFSDHMAEGNVVRCTFDMCDEMDRMAGIDGWHMSAEFTFADGKIACFLGLPPNPAEIERHQRAKRPFQMWAKHTHPDEWAKAFAFMPAMGFNGFNYELGVLRTSLAREWRASIDQTLRAQPVAATPVGVELTA